MVITGLVDVPDHSTICRFRCQLIEKGTLPLILKSINKDLEAKGLKVEKSKGAIVDATIIQSAGSVIQHHNGTTLSALNDTTQIL